MPRAPKGEKRPRDANQLGKLIVDEVRFQAMARPGSMTDLGAKRTQHEQCLPLIGHLAELMLASVSAGFLFTVSTAAAAQALVAARLLFERGVLPDNAITRVRRMRAGAIETRAQEDYLRALGRSDAARVWTAKA
jgi:hypothetical protein